MRNQVLLNGGLVSVNSYSGYRPSSLVYDLSEIVSLVARGYSRADYGPVLATLTVR